MLLNLLQHVIQRQINPKLFQDIDPTDWMHETLNELMLKIPEGFSFSYILLL